MRQRTIDPKLLETRSARHSHHGWRVAKSFLPPEEQVDDSGQGTFMEGLALVGGRLLRWAFVLVLGTAVIYFGSTAQETEAMAAEAVAFEAVAAVPNAPVPAASHVEVLLSRLSRSDFEQPSEVATGRFLEAFESDAVVLREVDLKRARPVSRGSDWAFVDVPFVEMQEEVEDDRFPWERVKPSEKIARVRLVEKGGEWKIEHVRVQAEG